MIYWNKELFAKKGLAYPQTFDEMVKAAEALTDPKEGTYGFVARGLKNANVPVWTSFLLGYGVDPVDANGKLMTDSPEAIEAAKLYQRLLTKSAPPGVSGFNWSECQSAFLQGKVGMWLDGVGFAPPLEDPEKSRVVGKVGYGVMPQGPEGSGVRHLRRRHRRHGGKQEEGGGLPLLPMGGLEADGRAAPAGRRRRAVPPVDPRTTRKSRKGVKMPAAWLDAVVESGKISKLGLPVVQPVTEFRDIMGIGLTNLLGGGDPAAEMKKATEQFRPVLERSEKA